MDVCTQGRTRSSSSCDGKFTSAPAGFFEISTNAAEEMYRGVHLTGGAVGKRVQSFLLTLKGNVAGNIAIAAYGASGVQGINTQGNTM